MNAKSMGISGLLGTLGQLGRPVFDKTGLTGVYDFTLEYAPNAGTVMALGGAPPPEATDSQAPSIAVAIQQQLGLKLEPSRAIVELLVIDKAEKTPVEN
jgi:uncharacterized protein (TIGR03435 family)